LHNDHNGAFFLKIFPELHDLKPALYFLTLCPALREAAGEGRNHRHIIPGFISLLPGTAGDQDIYQEK
jgi:hypothetical protein